MSSQEMRGAPQLHYYIVHRYQMIAVTQVQSHRNERLMLGLD